MPVGAFGHCKDCEFWQPPEQGKCFGMCDGGIPYDDQASIAYFVDQEGYSAGMYTKAEFGCALFVVKS